MLSNTELYYEIAIMKHSILCRFIDIFACLIKRLDLVSNLVIDIQWRTRKEPKYVLQRNGNF